MTPTLLRRSVVVFTILSVPTAIALINPSVPFGNTGCDSWVWFGLYSSNYQRFWDYPPSAYYVVGRLPGMFPGFVIYHLFSPVIATYVVYFLIFWTTLFACYVAARQFAQRWSALLAIVLFAFTPYVLWAAGNSYIGGVRDCYVAIALAAALVYFRTQAKWALWTGLLMIVCATYTHLMALIYLPSAALFLLLGRLRERENYSLLSAFSALLWRGVVVLTTVTGIFGTLNVLLVGRFWFFLPHFSEALVVWSRYDQDPVTLFDVITRPFIFFVLFVLYDSVKWLREHHWSPRAALVPDYGVILAIFWTQIILMFVTQALHMRSEQIDEYNSMVIGFIFVVMSIRVLETRSWGALILISGTLALGVAFTEAGLRADYMKVTLKWPQGGIHVALLAIIVAALALELRMKWPPHGQFLRAGGIATLCLASISAVGFSSYQPIIRGDEVFQNPQEYRAIHRALAAMSVLVPAGLPEIWSDLGVRPTQDHVAYLLRHDLAVASKECPLGYFWQTTFPQIGPGHITSGDPLAILVKADAKDALEDARNALATLSLRFELRGQTLLDYSGGPYTLILGVVRTGVAESRPPSNVDGKLEPWTRAPSN